MANSRKKNLRPAALAEPPVVPPAILERAKKSLDTDKILRVPPCVVCGAATSANSAEGLCWVCRRLKISAWHDTDVQMNAQE